jgi:formate/nitrite transporter FocA (FNT family)
MKKLLKVILPPFIGFFIFFAGVRYSTVYFTLKIDEMGLGNLKSFMAFYRYTLPLLFLVAVLTQLLIIVPIWRSLVEKTAADKVNLIIDLFFICFVFALGISYAIWDPQRGIHNLVKLVGFMSAVQLVYWSINLLILYLLE